MRNRIRRMRPALAAFALLTLAACAKNAPMDALSPEGPIAKQQDALFRPVFWIAAAIFFLVEGLFIYAVIKFRDRPGSDEPKQIHGHAKAELAWTLVPALLLVGVAIPTVVTIFDLDTPRSDDQLHVRVIGKQWWWEFEYQDTPAPHLLTANELVIPTGKDVFLELESSDVIHSFWVPKLAGKQDVVPGRINTMLIRADEPGEFYGACAEFCSISHANMRLRVHALSPGDFQQWVNDQRAPSVPPTPAVAAGAELFEANCAVCHQVRGPDDDFTKATGPNLTHLASRGTFGAGLYDLTPENLFRWVKNVLKEKPGVIMPVFEGTLDDGQIRSIVDYLMTLK